MKIKIQQFLCANHSWSVVGWNLARSFIKMGHDVCLYPTDCLPNKTNHLPIDLQPYVKSMAYDDFDMQVSYTAPINWGKYLNNGKNKFAIWAYEFNGPNVLPAGFAKHHIFTDKVLAPSEYVKDIFVNSHIPADKIEVVPHGIDLDDYKNTKTFPLKTKKNIKIGLPLGQLHRRKNIEGLLHSYFKAFNKDDDVCLVLKIQQQKQQKEMLHSFDVNFNKIYNDIKNEYKNRAEVEVVTEFIPDMIEFYNACDIIFTMSHCEGFYMPGLEALAANKIVIAPRHGGQLDFLNDDNSLLVEGKIVRSPKTYAYWSSSPYAEMFKPNIDDAVKKLRHAVDNYEELHKKLLPNMAKTAEQFTWDKAAEQIVELRHDA